MKLKALLSCAKDDEALTLLDEIDEEGMIARQYVMLPGRAVFPLDGMPVMNEGQLMTMMDIPQESQGRWNTTRAQMDARLKLMMLDARSSDIPAHIGWTGIAMNGMTVRPVFGEHWESKVGFVDNDLVKILADKRDLEVKERKIDGSRVYVMLNGMCNVGCLMPTIAHWTKRHAQELAEVAKEAQRVYANWENADEADGR